MANCRLTYNDNGRSVQVPLGAEIAIDLPENPTTGYRWSVRGLTGGCLALKSVEYSPTPGPGVGGGGTRHFCFLANTPGKTTLTLKNMREWEQEEKAIDEFSLAATVQ